MSEPHTATPCPFAVGVLQVSADVSLAFPRRARFDLALDAYKLGYFLVDIVEVTSDGAWYDEVELLAVQASADAFVIRGRVDRHLLDQMAGRLGMIVHELTPPSP